jgi:nitric oxide reductase NorD protein
VTASEPTGLQRFRLLATFITGRSVDIAEAPAGDAAHTNGQVIFVSAGSSVAEQRREMLIQSALLGAGSLDQRLVKALRARPSVARRYLALEGHRVLAELAGQLPLAAALCLDGAPGTSGADESLEVARGRVQVADPPKWFGVIRPFRLLAASAKPGAQPTSKELRLEFDPIDVPEADDDGDQEQMRESKILKLFENPLFKSQALSDYFRKLLGSSRTPGDGAAGTEMQVRSLRRAHTVGPNARPLPTRIHFTDDGKPGAAVGVGGALYPEWDVHNNRYRPEWCRVIDFPLAVAADISAAAVPHDDVLRRRLSRVGLGPKVLRARSDGDELDIEALIDLFVDLRSGYSPPEHVYLERRKLARNLGVLILLDASGSATDAEPGGLAVHDHQRRAAATLAATLEELGDRVAVYAFRSHGRHAVHLPAIKDFGQRFGAVGRARLNQLQPFSYTRLGAGIRGAGEILKTEAGTPNRLLLVLSDGFPYDDGYEGRYAEADAHKALDELRAEGVACLCLSIGATTTTDALERVFGSASYASAATLADLSPRMDELFLSSLRELSAPQPQRG